MHDAFVYSSDEEFLAGALPFLEEGIDLREPIIAAPTPANSALLRARLGRQAKAVDWAEGREAQRTVERHAILLQFIDRQQNRGATRIRVFGEPCWPSGGPGVAEWKRYESFLNVALADYPIWMVCPYDASRLSQDIVEDALPDPSSNRLRRRPDAVARLSGAFGVREANRRRSSPAAAGRCE